MRFVYGRQDMQNMDQAQANCFLMTNGRGGYASASIVNSVTRGDQGALIGAAVAPTVRYTLVQRMREYVMQGNDRYWLSTQEFVGRPAEDGYRRVTSFVQDELPCWIYEFAGITVMRRLVMKPGENATALLYDVENRSGREVSLCIEPGFVGLPKGQVPQGTLPWHWKEQGLQIGADDKAVICVKTNGSCIRIAEEWEELYYRDDARDGRCESGWNLRCLRLQCRIPAGETNCLEVILSDRPIADDGCRILEAYRARRNALEKAISFRDPTARYLALRAADYVVRRDSTGGSTIVAGYPFFADWGRDTMIALEGCVLAAGRTEEAGEILETFLAYERNGLVPNLFPEGGEAPRYNTADAALLLINSVWSYYGRTRDEEFLQRVYPAMERIIDGYCRGTDHHIVMDTDGLIRAGAGLDQVTWMDVCVDGILPTPRHGKPVEINAYWYNALRVMAELAPKAGGDPWRYEELASRVKESFLREFWREDAGCLKDVLSDTDADRQIRCNQIWAVTMPFTMLTEEQGLRVTETVYRELYTPCGLRTLSPADPQFHPNYGGEQLARDLAYHQGTVWVFPLGAFYRAWLKVHDFEDAAAWVRQRLACLEPMLREGCVGQLPEIYEGGYPGASCGCFAQAWSVGEILTVYERLEEKR